MWALLSVVSAVACHAKKIPGSKWLLEQVAVYVLSDKSYIGRNLPSLLGFAVNIFLSIWAIALDCIRRFADFLRDSDHSVDDEQDEHVDENDKHLTESELNSRSTSSHTKLRTRKSLAENLHLQGGAKAPQITSPTKSTPLKARLFNIWLVYLALTAIGCVFWEYGRLQAPCTTARIEYNNCFRDNRNNVDCRKQELNANTKCTDASFISGLGGGLGKWGREWAFQPLTFLGDKLGITSVWEILTLITMLSVPVAAFLVVIGTVVYFLYFASRKTPKKLS